MFCLLILPLLPLALAFFFFLFCPPCGQCDWSTWPSHLPAKVAPLCIYQLSHRPCSKSSLLFALWSSFIYLGSCEVLPWPLGQLDKIWFGPEDSCFCVSVCEMPNILPDWSVRRSASATSHNLAPYGSLIDWEADPKLPMGSLFKGSPP